MAQYSRVEEYETLEKDIWSCELLLSDSFGTTCNPPWMNRVLRSSPRRCRVQGLLHGLAFTVAARLVRTVL